MTPVNVGRPRNMGPTGTKRPPAEHRPPGASAAAEHDRRSREDRTGDHRNMTEQARVVVIGGGITGVSVAYHLAEAGWSDVLLVEKAGLTAGSTSQAAGLVTAFNPSSTMLAWRRYSIALYGRLGAFSAVGSLRLASSPEQLRELQRTASRVRGLGLDVEVISPMEARRLMPAIAPESLFGGVYLPGDGYLDPHGATHALAAAARELGVRIRTNTRVTGFELTPRREIRRVLTEAGAIDTELVVNAAGMWAPRVAEMVGAFIPSTPVDHQHVALRAVPGHELPDDMPCFRDPDNLVYGKSEHGGMLFGGYEAEPARPLARGCPMGARGDIAPAGLGTFPAAHGGRDPSLPVPRRCGGGAPRLPSRRDDPRREPADRADARRPRLLGRRRPVSQRVRRRRRDRAGRGWLDHHGRSRRRHRAVPRVAVRRHLPRSRVRGGPRSRDVQRLLPPSLPVRRRHRRPSASPLGAPRAPGGGGRGVRHEGGLGARRPPPTRRTRRHAPGGCHGSAAGHGPSGSIGWGRAPGCSRARRAHRPELVRQDRPIGAAGARAPAARRANDVDRPVGSAIYTPVPRPEWRGSSPTSPRPGSAPIASGSSPGPGYLAADLGWLVARAADLGLTTIGQATVPTSRSGTCPRTGRSSACGARAPATCSAR